jgi:Zn-dependent M16 (insulinase) family peptidase
MGQLWHVGYTDTISTESLKELVPEEYAAFMEAVGDELEDWVNDEIDNPEIDTAYDNLHTKFKEKYNLDLGVEYLLGCIDGEEDGVYWYIFDAFVKNPALVKLEEKVGKEILNRVWQVSYA